MIVTAAAELPGSEQHAVVCPRKMNVKCQLVGYVWIQSFWRSLNLGAIIVSVWCRSE